MNPYVYELVKCCLKTCITRSINCSVNLTRLGLILAGLKTDIGYANYEYYRRNLYFRGEEGIDARKRHPKAMLVTIILFQLKFATSHGVGMFTFALSRTLFVLCMVLMCL